jgi:hypothetical protein
MEDVGIFCGHSVNFLAIWYILWRFGIFCGHLVYIFPVLACCTKKKSGNPWPHWNHALMSSLKYFNFNKKVIYVGMPCTSILIGMLQKRAFL